MHNTKICHVLFSFQHCILKTEAPIHEKISTTVNDNIIPCVRPKPEAKLLAVYV